MAKNHHISETASRDRLHIRWKPEEYWLFAICALLALYLVLTATESLHVGSEYSRQMTATLLLACVVLSVILLAAHITVITIITLVSSDLFTSAAFKERLRDYWSWLPTGFCLVGAIWPVAALLQMGDPIWPWWWAEWSVGLAVAELLLVIPLVHAYVRSVTPKYFLRSVVGWEKAGAKELTNEVSGMRGEPWRLIVHEMAERAVFDQRYMLLKEVLNAVEKRAIKLLLIAPKDKAGSLAASLAAPFVDIAQIAVSTGNAQAYASVLSRLEGLGKLSASQGLEGAAVIFKEAIGALQAINQA